MFTFGSDVLRVWPSWGGLRAAACSPECFQAGPAGLGCRGLGGAGGCAAWRGCAGAAGSGWGACGGQVGEGLAASASAAGPGWQAGCGAAGVVGLAGVPGVQDSLVADDEQAGEPERDRGQAGEPGPAAGDVAGGGVLGGGEGPLGAGCPRSFGMTM